MKYMSGKGHVYKGSKPDGMSDEEYDKMMINKGYKRMEKSASPEEEVTMGNLEEVLTNLNDYVQKSDPEQLKNNLLQKAMEGDISEDENNQLRQLLKGGAPEETDSLAKQTVAGLQTDKIQKSIDASGYLADLHKGTSDGLESLAKSIESNQRESYEFNMLLAKSLVQIGQSLDALNKSVEAYGDQVPEQPTAAQKPSEVVEKSIAGNAPAGDKLTKSQVLDTMEQMHIQSLEKGMGGQARCGEDLQASIAKYEQTQRVSPSLAQEIKEFRASR